MHTRRSGNNLLSCIPMDKSACLLLWRAALRLQLSRAVCEACIAMQQPPSRHPVSAVMCGCVYVAPFPVALCMACSGSQRQGRSGKHNFCMPPFDNGARLHYDGWLTRLCKTGPPVAPQMYRITSACQGNIGHSQVCRVQMALQIFWWGPCWTESYQAMTKRACGLTGSQRVGRPLCCLATTSTSLTEASARP